ncbi:alpha/beta-hydrolase [Coniochaeta ligniaria NRRL 30616]|uniref:Alpha/beta-hydrolase n=1 Tax=Coniochaeta ligniaria NRRL 30616 TaxID=1408157 RepID=A0A1J7J1H0_9PEZI|nr:alpha/beta-hydrolase [Coniochaeta ligniaria NRRL 30616]
MATDKLTFDDPRVTHNTFTISPTKTYHYILASPPNPRATVLLIHGFPDLAFGWRYQVPHLLSLNLRVIVPDTLGYGRSSAPQDLASYSLKSMSADMIALASHVMGSEKQPLILGGHDWGGALVWRLALWYPSRVAAVFSVCTPYSPPDKAYLSPEQVVARLPNFTYQLQLIGPEVEAGIAGEAATRQFVNGMFGGRTPDGGAVFSTARGVIFDNLDKVGQSPLLSPEEVEVYVREYQKNGMRGPLNWYRTRKINYEEELELVERGRGRIAAPSLFVLATKDNALPPTMSAGMEAHFDRLERREVEATHWALVEAAAEVNGHVGRWLEGVLGGSGFKASI